MENSRNFHSTPTPPSFFKIFHPGSYTRLLIPQYFVKNLNKVKNPSILLKDSDGHFWNVKLRKIRNRLVMTKGWDRFVDAHKLELGDWLLFKHVENYVFDVQVFGLDGCNKRNEEKEIRVNNDHLRPEKPRKARFSRKTRKIVEETDENVMEEEDEVEVVEPPKATRDRSVPKEDKLKFIRVFGRNLGNYLKLPVKVADKCNIKPHEGTILRTANGDVTYKVKFKMVGGRMVVENARMRSFWQLVDVFPGDRCRFDVVLGSQRKVKEIILVKVTHNNKYY